MNSHLWKKLITVSIVVAGVIALLVGCGGASGSLKLDQTVYTVQYGEQFSCPNPKYVEDGMETEVSDCTIQAFDSYNNEVAVNYGIFYPEIGTYTVKYDYKGAKLEITVDCQDNQAPEISFTNLTQNAFVGSSFTLPSFTAKDISGVKKAKTSIALYKGDDTTPVATASGETVTIESAKEYRLVIFAEDNLGNGKENVFTIKVIDSWLDENLADNLAADFDEQEYLKNLVEVGGVEAAEASITDAVPPANKNGLGCSGSALKLLTTAETSGLDIYNLKEATVTDNYAYRIRVYIENGIDSIQFVNLTKNVAVRTFNLGDMPTEVWTELELKTLPFELDSIDAFGIRLTGKEGKAVYIDQIEMIHRYVDKDLKDNILLDFDEREIYSVGQITSAWDHTPAVYGGSQLTYIQAGEAGLPSGAHGGVVRIEGFNSMQGIHSWFFQDYVTLANIDAMTFRIYVDQEFVQNHSYLYFEFIDYNGRCITAYYINGESNHSFVPGWNEVTFYTPQIRTGADSSNTTGVVHGFRMVLGGASHNASRGVFYLDEVRTEPIAYVDGDLSVYETLASYNKQEYVIGNEDMAPNTTAVQNAKVSIVDFDSTSSLKAELSSGGKVKLNFGPNASGFSGADRGMKFKLHSDKANTLRVYAYGAWNRVVDEWVIDVNQGWGEYSMTNANSLYADECEIYYLIVAPSQAGTIHIDYIGVETETAPNPTDGTILFEAKDAYAKYSFDNKSRYQHGIRYQYSYDSGKGALQVLAPNTTSNIGMFDVSLRAKVNDITDGILAVELYAGANVKSVYFAPFGQGSHGTEYKVKSGTWQTIYVPTVNITSGVGFDGFQISFESDGSADRNVLSLKKITYITDRSGLVDYQIAVTGGTADMDKAKVGETVTFTLDESAVPEGKSFAAWSVNGVVIDGNTYMVRNEDLIVEAKFVGEENPIPAGAILLQAYKGYWNAPVANNWGTMDLVGQWYDEFHGANGVMGFGSQTKDFGYVRFEPARGELADESRDLVLRVYVTERVRAISVFAGGIDIHKEVKDEAVGSDVLPVNQWYEWRIPLKDILGGQTSQDLYIDLSCAGAGAVLYIDQIYID